MVRGGPPALNSINFGVWVVFFTAAVSKHVGAKHVLNMAIPDGETEDEMNKRISDYGDTNDLVSDGGLFQTSRSNVGGGQLYQRMGE